MLLLPILGLFLAADAILAEVVVRLVRGSAPGSGRRGTESTAIESSGQHHIILSRTAPAGLH
jgi:hypothetical protein